MNYGMPRTSGTMAFMPSNVQSDFIRRVYGLFFASVLVTVAIGVFCAQPALAPAMLGMMPVLAIGTFVCIIGLFFARRVPGLNMALFYLFSALEGAIIGPELSLIQRFAPGVPVAAAVITVAVFGGLSLYAVTSRKDFSYLGGMLFAGLIGLMVTGLVLFFVHAAFLQTLYALFGVLIFSGYVLYDTSNILRRVGPGDEVMAAISLYLDLLNLFWFILQLLMDFNSRRD